MRGEGANAGWDAFSKCPAHRAVGVVACGSPCTGRTSGRGRTGSETSDIVEEAVTGTILWDPLGGPRGARQEGDGGTREGAVGVACSGQSRCGPMGVLERTSRSLVVRLDVGGWQCHTQKPGRKVQTPPSPGPIALTPGSGLSRARAARSTPSLAPPQPSSSLLTPHS